MSIDNSNLGQGDQQRQHAGTIAAKIEGTQALLDTRLDILKGTLETLVNYMLAFNQRTATAYELDKDQLRSGFLEGLTHIDFDVACPRYVGDHAMDVSYGGIGKDPNIIQPYEVTKVSAGQAKWHGAFFPKSYIEPPNGKPTSLLDFYDSGGTQSVLKKTTKKLVKDGVDRDLDLTSTALLVQAVGESSRTLKQLPGKQDEDADSTVEKFKKDIREIAATMEVQDLLALDGTEEVFNVIEKTKSRVKSTRGQAQSYLSIVPGFNPSLHYAHWRLTTRSEQDLSDYVQQLANITVGTARGVSGIGIGVVAEANETLGALAGFARDLVIPTNYYINPRLARDIYVLHVSVATAVYREYTKRLNAGEAGKLVNGERGNVKKRILNALERAVLGTFEADEKEKRESVSRSFETLKAEVEEEELALEGLESAKDSWRFDPQAYLYFQIEQVARPRMEAKIANAKSDMPNLYLAEVSPPFVNNLFQSANKRVMMDLKTPEASHIVPRVRLFSVKSDLTTRDKIKETQIELRTFLDRRDIANVFNGKRGGGAGLTDVEIQFQGTDLVSVDKLFSVKLRLFLQDVETLTKSNSDSHIMRLIEYPVKTQANSTVNELRLEVGWNVSDVASNLISRSERAAIEANKMSLMLGLKDHTFTVNQDGTLGLDIEYIARLESTLGDIDADIFPEVESGELEQLLKVKRQLNSEEFNQKYDDAIDAMAQSQDVDVSLTAETTDQEDPVALAKSTKRKEGARRRARKENIKEINKTKAKNLRTKYKSIMDRLKDNKKLYSAYAKQTDVELFKDYCFLAESAEPVFRQPHNLNISLDGSGPPPTKESKKITFFYFGDFLDEAIATFQAQSGIKLDRRQRKYEFVLGMVPTISSGQGPNDLQPNRTLHNLAFMPITIETYTKWFEDNVNKKNRVIYPFFDFIKDVCNNLIFKVLGGNLQEKSERMKPPVSRLSMNNFVVNHNSKLISNNPSRVITEKQLLNRKKNTLLPSRHQAKGLRELLFLYALPGQGSAEYMTGKKKEDFDHGIHHLVVGRDKGLLKSINFAKANIPGWRESQTLKAVSEGHSHIFATAPYNCDITLIGNTLFKPGMTVYVDPLVTGFGSVANRNSIASTLQIGGYYTILGVTHFIRGQVFETQLRCVHNSMPNLSKELRRPKMITIADAATSMAAAQAAEDAAAAALEEEQKVDDAVAEQQLREVEMNEFGNGPNAAFMRKISDQYYRLQKQLETTSDTNLRRFREEVKNQETSNFRDKELRRQLGVVSEEYRVAKGMLAPDFETMYFEVMAAQAMYRDKTNSQSALDEYAEEFLDAPTRESRQTQARESGDLVYMQVTGPPNGASYIAGVKRVRGRDVIYINGKKVHNPEAYTIGNFASRVEEDQARMAE
tara:strand:+ start:8399 stop:12559 length:4161 start_codon:yes stop_codon:yes gene_type:complete